MCEKTTELSKNQLTIVKDLLFDVLNDTYTGEVWESSPSAEGGIDLTLSYYDEEDQLMIVDINIPITSKNVWINPNGPDIDEISSKPS